VESELFLVSNSLGNELDLPPRTLESLLSADCIIGEEARSTSTLLKRLGISKDFLLLNEHTTKEELFFLADSLSNFRKICILSDAGNPGIEDPASRLVPLAWAKGIKVRSSPGPVALVSGLAASGFPTSPFVFLGFLPREEKERIQVLKKHLTYGMTLVFYETPYRTKRVLESLTSLGLELVFLNLGIGLSEELTFRGNPKDILKSKIPKLPPVFVLPPQKTRGTMPK